MNRATLGLDGLPLSTEGTYMLHRYVLVLLHDLVHLLLPCRGALSRGRGHGLLFSVRAYHQENKFPILEMSLLHCFAVTKEMAVGSTTSGILYNLFPKVTITAQALDSYTACRFHKYGWHNNTSQTSTGETSHNTSSLKGMMLYGRWHCWLTRRSHPWWSHPMVYSCGCVVVSKPSRFMTSTEMRSFWLPLLTMNYSGEPFTHIWEWKRRSSSSGSSSSSF